MTGPALIPAPVSMSRGDDALVVTAATTVYGPARVVDLLTETFARHTGVELARSEDAVTAVIRLRLVAGEADSTGWSAGDEGYRLRIGSGAVELSGSGEAGLVRGIQTLVQLAEPGADGGVDGAVRLSGVVVEDRPRYRWRGVMLDIARHFFGVEAITRVIDLATAYKFNVLHLHLTDDQGWRLEIAGRPELTEIGGRTQVGDGPGGHLTREQYAEIVAYAAARHVTVVPEIDLPGHTNAALLAFPDLAPEGYEPKPYRGTEVGFSSLDAQREDTYALVEDIVRELAAVQPGGYVHIGGDEALSTSDAGYRTFMARTLAIVEKHGMRPVGWQEVVRAELPDEMLVQYWDTRAAEQAAEAVRRGLGIIVSPADRVYLDMKYDAGHPIGHDWAGLVDVRDAYDWDPDDLMPAGAVVRGIEAPLWTETITTIAEIEAMLVPRLPAVAERAWSPAASRDWDEFRVRLATHEGRWQRLGLAYHRSSQIDWPSERL